MAKQIYPTTITFNQGLNTSVSPVGSKLHPVIMNNVWLAPDDLGGGLAAIPGYVEGNAPGGSPDGDVGDDVALQSVIAIDNGTDRMLVVTGGTKAYYIFNDTMYGSFRTGLTGARKWAFVFIGGVFHAFDGVDTPFKTTVHFPTSDTAIGLTRLDMDGATATPSFGAGNVKGVVRYYISEQSATTEGPLSLAFGEVDAAEGATVLLAMSDSLLNQSLNGKTLNLYRTQANSYDPLFLARISGTTTTSYNDDIADADLGTLPYLHGDPPPESIFAAVVHLNRVFGLGSAEGLTSRSELYFSDLPNPESYWTDSIGNHIPVFNDDGDIGTALAKGPEGIFIFKKHHTYVLLGKTTDTFSLTELLSSDPAQRQIGTPSIRSLAWTPKGLAFYYDAKVYLLQGSRPVAISAPIEEELRKVRERDEEDGIVLGTYPKYNLLLVAAPISQTGSNHYSNKTFLYNWELRQWVGTINRGFNGFTIWDLYGEDQECLALSNENDANGLLYKIFSGTTANGGDWETEFELSPFYGASVNKPKRYRYVDIIYRTAANQSFNFEYYFDGDVTSLVSVTITDPASPPTVINRRRVKMKAAARSISLRFTSNVKTGGVWTVLSCVVGVQYLED